MMNFLDGFKKLFLKQKKDEGLNKNGLSQKESKATEEKVEIKEVAIEEVETILFEGRKDVYTPTGKGKRDFIREANPEKKESFIKSLLKEDLNDKDVYLIDFENTGRIPREVYSNPKNVLLVFVGNTQTEAYKNHIQKISCVARQYPVHAEKTGSNFLDNRLSLYTGMIIGRYTPRSVCIVSDDHDYTLLHNTLKECGIEFRQIFPKENDAMLFEIKDDYLDRIANDLRIRGQGGCLSRRTIRKAITQSKLTPIHPKMVDEIFERLLKSKRIESIDAGKYKGCYRVTKNETKK